MLVPEVRSNPTGHKFGCASENLSPAIQNVPVRAREHKIDSSPFLYVGARQRTLLLHKPYTGLQRSNAAQSDAPASEAPQGTMTHQVVTAAESFNCRIR
jgi:hypothetical protein